MQAFTVQSVAFGYRSRAVFTDLSLAVPRGALTALVGGNGAGKSTLLSLLAGVHKPHAGRVQAHIPGRAALVVQRSAVPDAFPITVQGAVGMGRWAHSGLLGRTTAKDRRAVEEAMERLGIRELADRPLGELSGGQRQRALVAQGLAQDSAVLLLDEPDASLDQSALQLINEVLRAEVRRGVTVLQSTHDAAQAATADCCIRLAGGKAAVETPDDAVPGSRCGLERTPDFP
ncbi:zinc ABC transporter ATP-binding protein AztA [Arthrobacter sp. NPDC097144]|uniref:zinc ABC transporter ATP-binding protein AztA n=1 Tax=Arthrobacter sp. NPDC097144 TaxID=3363946 RepID=UPI003826E824